MKKAKRMLSLVLAVMLVMSVFVLPASAAASKCPMCGHNTYSFSHQKLIERSSYHVMDGSCPSGDYYHPHFINEAYDVYLCTYCGYRNEVYVGLIETCIND